MSAAALAVHAWTSVAGLVDPEPLTGLEAVEEVAARRRACGFDPSEECLRYFELTGQNESMTRIINAVAPYVASLIRVVVIVVIAFVLQRLAKRGIRRFIRGLTEQGIARLGSVRAKAPMTDTGPLDLGRAKLRAETLGAVLRSIVTFVVWTLATLMVLGEFNVNLGPLIAGAGIVGIALGFGAQRLVQDFISGVFILMEDQYGIGDVVDVGEATGTIELITLRVTKLRDVFGTVWYVPNGEIRRIGNKSQQWARALVDVGVAYDTDIARATDVILATAQQMADDDDYAALFHEPPEVWGVQELGADEVTIRLVAKVAPLKQWAIERELRARLKAALDDAKIEIPFPQRTVWVRSDTEEPLGVADTDGDAPSTPRATTRATTNTTKKATAKKAASKKAVAKKAGAAKAPRAPRS